MLKFTSGFVAAILFFITQSFALDISSIQTGNINLGTSPSAILNLNNGGVLNGNLTMGNSEQITNFNGGVLNGTINGAGKVVIFATTNLGGNIGGSTAITALNINSILNTNTRNITTTTITIADNGTLNYGGGTLVAEIQGERSGVGNFVFNNTKTANFNIGQTNQLANINIVDSITVTLGGNIAATAINIGNGNSGRLKSDGKNISASNINLAQGAILEISSGSLINGAINGNVSGNGIVQFSGSSFTQNNSLGATIKLAQILISNETTLNINDDVIFNADDITIGEGLSGAIGAPVLNQNNGTVGADLNSQIRLNTDSTFNYNGGIINGTIRGTSSNKGTLNINHDYTNNFEIGKSFDLANLNIANGKTLTANANISANNINVAGNLNLSSSAKIITGNLTTSGGAAIIDLGNYSHTISGNFTTFSGDILKLNALNNSNVGNLKIAGNAVIADGVDLKISFDSNQGYLSDGTNFAIISAALGEINVIDDANIDVNNLGSNQSGLLTFHTKKSGNNLLLIVDRKGAETFTDNKSAATIYKTIDQVGSSATGELRSLQKFIDSPITNNAQKEAALKSTIPQNNQDLNNSSYNSAKASVGVSEARLQNVLLKQNNFAYDKIFDSQAIWLQGFQTSAKQENVGDFAGYNYFNHGLAIGIDQEIIEDLRLGISASLANANVKSTSANKRETVIDSYQFNLYSGYNFAPYFMSGILGMAINQYNSIRTMPELGLIAGAKYGGQTYIAKFETGMIQKLDYNLVLTSKISLTAAQNQIATYNESGAGTLNLNVSNEHNNFLEGRVGGDLNHNGLEILSAKIKPKIKLSYGYDFLAQSQSSRNRFQGQSSSFEIKNSNIDKASLKYGLGFDVCVQEGIFLAADYDVEEKANYKSNSGSLYLRYDF
ncbi:MAG: autotransporter domain-containing protein [Pseudomonadota bacterium]